MKKREAEAALVELYLWREARGLPIPDGDVHFSFFRF
jgi:hypothetical protein